MGWIIGILLVVLILTVLGRRNLLRHNEKADSESKGDSALKALEKRFAKGEISEEEFEEKKAKLKQS